MLRGDQLIWVCHKQCVLKTPHSKRHPLYEEVFTSLEDLQQSSRSTMASTSCLSKANATFALALFKELSENDPTGNIFYSPFSISSALAMVMLGARGNTYTQMSKCLKTQDCEDDVNASFNKLLSELDKKDAAYALSIANRLYGEQSYEFIENFLEQTRTYYKAELETVDFRTSWEAARSTINSWVSKQTEGKITDAIAQGMLNNLTRLVLVNAIYFKGTWDKPFLHVRTQDAQFRVSKNETKTVQMMEQKSYFPYVCIPEADCEILQMPYKGNDLSMLIFLPKEIRDDTTGLEKLEKMLTYEKYFEWTGKMTKVEVNVSLPRFKMEETYDLNSVLKRMGMVDAFEDGKADFSGMSGAKDLIISQVAHKAFVEVNEEGTEAAAVTSVFFELYCLNLQLVYFRADHPFLFFIQQNTTSSILFAGRFCSPVTTTGQD